MNREGQQGGTAATLINVTRVAEPVRVKFRVDALPEEVGEYRSKTGLNPRPTLATFEVQAHNIDAKQRPLIDAISRLEILNAAAAGEAIDQDSDEATARRNAAHRSLSLLTQIKVGLKDYTEANDLDRLCNGAFLSHMSNLRSSMASTIAPVTPDLAMRRYNDLIADISELPGALSAQFERAVATPLVQLQASLAGDADTLNNLDSVESLIAKLKEAPLSEVESGARSFKPLEPDQLGASWDSHLDALLATFTGPLAPVAEALKGWGGILRQLRHTELELIAAGQGIATLHPWVINEWRQEQSIDWLLSEGTNPTLLTVSPFAKDNVQIRTIQFFGPNAGSVGVRQLLGAILEKLNGRRGALVGSQMAEWVSKFGSDALKKSAREGFKWEQTYNNEVIAWWFNKIQVEGQGGGVRDVIKNAQRYLLPIGGASKVEILDRNSPSEEAFAIRDFLVAQGARAAIHYIKGHREIPGPGVEGVLVTPPMPGASQWVLVGPHALSGAKKKAGGG